MLDKMLEYLRKIDGACAWKGSLGVDGSPQINLVLCGQYYGFYVRPKSRRVSNVHRAAIDAINAADGIALTVRSIEDIANALGRYDDRVEMHRKIPMNAMRGNLVGWGKGDYRLKWVGDLVTQLPAESRAVVVMRFVDRMRVEDISNILHYSERTIQRTIRASIYQLCEWVSNK